MRELLSQQTPIARKEYNCMAWEFLKEATFDPGELTFKQLRAIARAKAAKGRILPGQRYLKQNIKDDGIEVFRAIPDIHQICFDFDLYYD